jgi:thiosulfate/3-mercaptopyruvate sulfurtransferase
MTFSPIIEVTELFKNYKTDNLVLVDVSNNKNAKENYLIEHLDGAVFIDLNTQLADIKTDLSNGGRHPLPSIEDFTKTLRNIGIDKTSHVVAYDNNNGSNAAARFWWMLKAIGHMKVQVLNGGLNEAKKHNFPLSSRIKSAKNKLENYQAKRWGLAVAEMDDVEKNMSNENHLIIDVRDTDRYNGVNEPIDLIAGHIPNAINIPFIENLDNNGLFLKPDELRIKYERAFGNIKAENIIIHCGSGVTACHTILAIDYAGLEIPKLYVGSWSEWSRNNKKISSK